MTRLGCGRDIIVRSSHGKVRGPGGAIITGPDSKTQYMVCHTWNRELTECRLCIDRHRKARKSSQRQRVNLRRNHESMLAGQDGRKIGGKTMH
jgi:hypothetical protein